MAESHEERRADGIVIHITHQELSELAGTTRETTTLTLHRFKQVGLLRTGHGHTRCQILIIDLPGLREVAEGRRSVPAHRRSMKVGMH